MDHEQQVYKENSLKDRISSFLQYRLNAEVEYLITTKENEHLEGTNLTDAIKRQILETIKKEDRSAGSVSLSDEEYFNLTHPIDQESGHRMDLVQNAIHRAQRKQTEARETKDLLGEK